MKMHKLLLTELDNSNQNINFFMRTKNTYKYTLFPILPEQVTQFFLFLFKKKKERKMLWYNKLNQFPTNVNGKQHFEVIHRDSIPLRRRFIAHLSTLPTSDAARFGGN